MSGRTDGDQIGICGRAIPIPMMTIFAFHIYYSAFSLYQAVSSFTVDYFTHPCNTRFSVGLRKFSDEVFLVHDFNLLSKAVPL